MSANRTDESEKIETPFDELVLEAFKISASKTFGMYTLDHAKLWEHADMIGREFAIHMKSLVMGESVKEEEIQHRFRYPKNWWEHIKYDHAPEWFLKRYPVKWKWEEMRTTVKHCYGLPKFNRFLPKEETENYFPILLKGVSNDQRSFSQFP